MPLAVGSSLWVWLAISKQKKDEASMLNPFKPLELIKAEVFTSLPQ